VSKYIFQKQSTDSLSDLPQGQLFISRRRSSKGHAELIFTDCAASIRRTPQEFQYQLVVQRAYEEGEAELLEEEEQQDLADIDKDERSFLLDEELRLHAEIRSDGHIVFTWLDTSGNNGDSYEFICDKIIKQETASAFSLVAAQCQFERKYRKSAQTATEEQLSEFDFEDEEHILEASPSTSLVHDTQQSSRSPPYTKVDNMSTSKTVMAKKGTNEDTALVTPSKAVTDVSSSKTYEASPTAAPPMSTRQISSGEVLTQETAELHLYDFESGTFRLQDPSVTVTVSDIGSWTYWMHIVNGKKQWLGQEVNSDINPVFNFEYLSFLFNHYTDEGEAYSWLLKFPDRNTIEAVQHGIMRAVWEHLNQTKWLKANDADRDYVLDAFNDLVLEDEREVEARQEDEAAEEAEGSDDDEDDRPRSEHYDDEESDDDVDPQDRDGNINSLLAVGAKHDRSFVVRGHKIGVFKHTPENHLEFSTNINKVQTPKGKLFSPKKIMLHAGDTDMILQNEADPNILYRMDLEHGKVVDEWKIHDHISVNTFAPESVSCLTSTRSDAY